MSCGREGGHADGRLMTCLCRLIISDGVHFIQAMLATQLNDLVNDGQLDKFTVVQLPNFACQNVSGRKLVVCLSVEILGNPQEKIGNPSTVEQSAAPAAAAGDAEASNTLKENKGRQNDAYKAGPAKKAGGKPPAGSAPIYPIEGLSPYQNKCVSPLSAHATPLNMGIAAQMDDQSPRDEPVRDQALLQRAGRRQVVLGQPARRDGRDPRDRLRRDGRQLLRNARGGQGVLHLPCPRQHRQEAVQQPEQRVRAHFRQQDCH